MVIVYKTDSGFTKRYAEMFADKVGMECHSLHMARIKVSKKSDIIYFGRVIQGEVEDLKKARKRYNILAVCPVGLKMPTDAVKTELKQKNDIGEDCKMFYLRGGFDPEQNLGLEKTLISLIVSDLESKEELDAVDAQYLNDLKNGADYVREMNLQELSLWYEKA